MSPFVPLADRAPSALWLRGFWVYTGAAVVAFILSLYSSTPVDRLLRGVGGALLSSVAPTNCASLPTSAPRERIQHLRCLRQAARNQAVISVGNRRAWPASRSTARRPALQVQALNSSVPLTLLVRRQCCPYARSQRIQDFETANSSQ